MSKFAMFFRKYGHKILTFCIGLAFLAGCFALVFAGVKQVYHLFRPSDIYEAGWDSELVWPSMAFDELRDTGLPEGSEEYFEVFIANFVRQDFKSFKDPIELNTDYFISYGLWQALDANVNGIYQTDESGTLKIPKADVEKFARYNFDFTGEIKHHDLKDVDGGFDYDSLSGCYRVQAGMGGSYLVPDVVEVKVDEATGLTTLKVDCYRSEGLTAEDVTQDASKFVKCISITLQRVDDTKEVDGQVVMYTNYLYKSCSMVESNGPTVVEDTAEPQEGTEK
jgi:hypothetical protein